MGRIYTATGEIAAYTGGADSDFLQITCAADKVLLIHAFEISQSSSETDDSARVTFETRTAAKTGGSTINALAVDPGDAADSATVIQSPDTGSPTDTIQRGWAWSALAGLEKIFTPETRIVLGGQDVGCFKFKDTITAVDLTYTVVFEEIG